MFAVPAGVSGGTATVAGIGFANGTNIVRNVNALPQFPIGFAASPVQAHVANRAKQPKFSGIPGDYQTFLKTFNCSVDRWAEQLELKIFRNFTFSKTLSTKQMPKFVHRGCYQVRVSFHIKFSRMKWTRNIRCE